MTCQEGGIYSYFPEMVDLSLPKDYAQENLSAKEEKKEENARIFKTAKNIGGPKGFKKAAPKKEEKNKCLVFIRRLVCWQRNFIFRRREHRG